MGVETNRLEAYLHHAAGTVSFLALFAGVYVLIAGMAFGLNILQALYVDVGAFLVGSAGVALVRLRRQLHRRRAVRTARGFAVRCLSVAPAHRDAPTKKARTAHRPGLAAPLPA